jgi:membrane protease YdiL (CAAX protease family)
MRSSAVRFAGRLFDAGWRVVLYGGLLVGTVLLLSRGANFGLHAAHIHFGKSPGIKPVEELIIAQLITLVGAIAAVAVMRRVDRERAIPPLLPRRRAGGAHFAQGLAWGFVAFAATIAGIAALGGYRVAGLALSGSSLVYYGGLWCAAAILNGAAENLAVLGYPLQRLGRVAGLAPAILLMAGLFALAHLGNAGENPLGLVSVFMIAV